MSEKSQRTNIRLPIKMKVLITTEDYCTWHLMTENFSDGGIFIPDQQLALLPVGSLLTVQSDEGIEHAPVINARIAWTNSVGAGLEYILDENE